MTPKDIRQKLQQERKAMTLQQIKCKAVLDSWIRNDGYKWRVCEELDIGLKQLNKLLTIALVKNSPKALEVPPPDNKS